MLQLSCVPHVAVQLLPPKPPAQRKVQPPPGHVKVQLASTPQVMSQPPPAQSALQVDSPSQTYVQSPPAHFESQLAEPLQVL